MEKDRLLLCISRYDHYYDSINNKCNVFLTLSIAIVGGLVAAYPTLLEKVNCGIWLHINMAVLLVAGLANILFTVWTSIPFLKKGGDSLLYFGNVATINVEEFAAQSACETEDRGLVDLRRQVHVLARGLHAKFRYLKIAGTLLLIQAVFFFPLVVLIVINLKQL